MTQRVTIERDCDVCEAEGRQREALTYVVSYEVPGETPSGLREVELCSQHSAKLLGPLVAMLDAVPVKRPPSLNGSAPKAKATTRRRRQSEMPGMTVHAAATRLAVTDTTLYQWIKDGRVDTIRDENNHIRVTEEALAAAMAARS